MWSISSNDENAIIKKQGNERSIEGVYVFRGGGDLPRFPGSCIPVLCERGGRFTSYQGRARVPEAARFSSYRDRTDSDGDDKCVWAQLEFVFVAWTPSGNRSRRSFEGGRGRLEIEASVQWKYFLGYSPRPMSNTLIDRVSSATI